MSQAGSAGTAGALALQNIKLSEAELEAIWPAAERNAATTSRLSERVQFEDEPAAYARIMERARG